MVFVDGSFALHSEYNFMYTRCERHSENCDREGKKVLSLYITRSRYLFSGDL